MSYKQHTILSTQEDTVKFIQADELLDQMTQSEISFRRSMLIFCTVCIVAEYGVYEKLCAKAIPEFDFFLLANRMKSKYKSKINCLDLYIDTTMETKITFKDIDHFTATVLNPYLGTEFGKTLGDISRKILSEAHKFYNPRPLKDLARCKIRTLVPSSMLLTEQVNRFMIPETLKQYILFHSDKIWELLIKHQEYMHLNQQLKNRRVLERQNARDN